MYIKTTYLLLAVFFICSSLFGVAPVVEDMRVLATKDVTAKIFPVLTDSDFDKDSESLLT